MTESVESPRPAVLHRVFYGPSELRAGWRLLIFLGMVIAFISAGNLAVRRLLHGADSDTLFLVREIMDFLMFLFASWIMGRIEGRTIASYGLPWRRMFGGQFWQGVLLSFASITGLLVAMRVAGVFRFGGIALHGDIWKWATICALVFILVALREEFRARGYGLFTLSAGIGFWPAAVLSAAYFGYSHHGNSGEDWVGLFNAGMSLEFLRRGLSLSRFETPYVSGWYEKTGSQIYVNRGIGSIGFPIRLGARPEITVFGLTRGG
jgi:uncharacterized protein